VRLDVLASREHYWPHLGPVWEALPSHLRGTRGSEVGAAGAVLVCSARDLTTAAQAGYERVAYLEHGIGQPYGDVAGYPGGKGRELVSLFLSPNATAAALDRARHPHARVVEVGDPALDDVPQLAAAGEPVVAVSFHWDAYAVPEMRSAYLHHRLALPALVERYHVIGHGHPLTQAKLARTWRRLGVELVPSWAEVCQRASLYVCDNSSTLYEFASTDRPVVVLNAPWYRRHVEHGLRFWSAAGVGVQVDEPGQLVAGVEEALEDRLPQQLARERALAIAYAHRRGAAERAAHALEEWLA
jgi:hypothetical protein